MTLITDTINWLARIREPKLHQIHGTTYATDSLVAMPGPVPLAVPLGLGSLSALVSYVASQHDVPHEGRALLIEGPASVAYVDKLTKEFRQRECFARAQPTLAAPLEYGKFYDLEPFIISVQTLFGVDDESVRLQRFVGSVTKEDSIQVADDGVSQQVVVRKGIQRVGPEAVPNPFTLRPYRTFPEVTQPASRFIVRFRGGGEGKFPTAALFEVVDVKWRNDAVDSIEQKLVELLDAAGVKVPIFA